MVLSSIVLAALAANPCFAKDGHALHGARANAPNNRAGGKGASGNGVSANPVPSKADVPIDAEAAIAPPVLPPRRGTPQQIRIINPSVKTANPGNSSHNQTGAMTSTVPTARNAIGEPVVSPKNFPGARPPLPALQRPSAVSPPIIPGGPVVPRVGVANTTNRGSVNGTTVIRPATGPSVIGGPAQARYGINGTTMQKRQ